MFIKILLPIAAAWLFSLAPLPLSAMRQLLEARQAQADGYHQLAAARLRAVLAAQPGRVELWEAIGEEEWAAGRADPAFQALLEAQSARALSARGRLLLGDLYAARGDTRLALDTWQALLDENGPSADIYRRQADLLKTTGDDAQLLAVYQAWHALEPGNGPIGYALGLRLAVQDPQQALPILMDAARRDAGVDENVQVLRKGINQSAVAETPAYGWVMIGRSLARLNEWRLARQAFEQAVAAGPDYAEAWAFLAEARYQTGDSGEEALSTALQLNPRSTLVQAITAVYWRRQGRLDEALSYLEAVARQEPNEYTWQIELGGLLAEKGDLQSARAHFQQATELAPNDLVPWLALAQYAVAYHDDVSGLGLPAARQALALGPDDARALDIMGLVFLALDDPSSAERFLQRAIKQDAAFADAYLHLGQLFLQQQDQVQAKTYLLKAFELGQGQPAAEIASRLLQRYFNEGDLP